MPEDFSEDSTAPKEQLYASKVLESKQLREIDGIGPNLLGFDHHFLHDPVTKLNPFSDTYDTLSDDERISIDLRIQKYAVIQLAQHMTRDLSDMNENIDEKELNEKYQDARSVLHKKSERMYAYMDEHNIPYEFKDPLTGKELPRDSLRILLFNKSIQSGGRLSNENSFKIFQNKCQKFYRENQSVIPPDPIVRFDSQLYLGMVDAPTLFKETYIVMQESVINTVQKMIVDTHQSKGYFFNAANELSYLTKPSHALSQIIDKIPAVARLYLRYYEEKGYTLPHSQDDIHENDIANAINIMNNCARAVTEHDKGTKQNHDAQIQKHLDRYGKILQRNLQRPRVATAPHEQYSPIPIKEHDIQTHRLVIEQYDMNYDETIRKWELASSIPMHNDTDKNKELYASKIIKKNLEMMQMMELLKPGISKALYDNFGIINYSRYPLEILIDQYDHMNDADIDYGISLFATEDHNGAFLESTKVWREFNTSLQKENQHIRIIEAENKVDLARRMLHLRTHYRPQISWGLINAHGHQKGFMLSSPPIGRITSEDVDLVSAKTFLQFFKPEAPLAFISCSTGSFEGIAHTISTQKDGVISGPEYPTNIASLMWKNGEVQTRYNSGVTMRYKNGVNFWS